MAYYLTFDVETRGLYGEAFAYGAALTNNDGETIFEETFAVRWQEAKHAVNDSDKDATDAWLDANVDTAMLRTDGYKVGEPGEMRKRFYAFWKECDAKAKQYGEELRLAADVAFPCETNFLSVVASEHADFYAYPLVDVSSLLLAKGYDPIGTFERQPDELPAHNPLCDARQSSRILHQLLRNEKVKPKE